MPVNRKRLSDRGIMVLIWSVIYLGIAGIINHIFGGLNYLWIVEWLLGTYLLVQSLIYSMTDKKFWRIKLSDFWYYHEPQIIEHAYHRAYGEIMRNN